MPGDTGEISAPAKNAREYLIYTLVQLRAKISENTLFTSNLKHVHDSATCRFRLCDKSQPPTLLGTKLHVGSYAAKDSNTQAVWAHIRSPAFKIAAKANNHVKYILDNGAVLKISELKNITFVEPFSYIESPEHETGRDKIRYLILFFFLERGYSDSIEFTKSGFVTFRIAIANIAKARAQANINPHPPPATADQHHQSLTRVTCSNTADKAQAPVPTAASKSAETPKTETTTKFSQKRKQYPEDESTNTERPIKKLNDDSGLYHLSKLMQHLHGHTNEEIGSLDAKNAKLETRLLEMMEQRDKWENDAKFVKEQLKESEKQRHEAGARLEMVQKQVITLETDKAKLLKEMEGKDKLLKGEREVSKVQSGKAVSMLRELEHLRAVKKQFLSLAASLKSGGSSHSDT